MALQTSGPISLLDIQNEFGGPTPIVITNYYRGGSYVQNISTNNNVPTSGPIALTNFYGATNQALYCSVSGGGTVQSTTSYTFTLTATTNVPSPSYAWTTTGGTLSATTGSSVTLTFSDSPNNIVSEVVTCTVNGSYSGSATCTIKNGSLSCFTGDTRILTALGYQRFDELPEEFSIINLTGFHRAKLIVHENSEEPMRQMGRHLVTERHLIKVGEMWVPASDLFHEKVAIKPRTVYNAHVITDNEADRHYLLENGLVAHNIKA